MLKKYLKFILMPALLLLIMLGGEVLAGTCECDPCECEECDCANYCPNCGSEFGSCWNEACTKYGTDWCSNCQGTHICTCSTCGKEGTLVDCDSCYQNYCSYCYSSACPNSVGWTYGSDGVLRSGTPGYNVKGKFKCYSLSYKIPMSSAGTFSVDYKSTYLSDNGAFSALIYVEDNTSVASLASAASATSYTTASKTVTPKNGYVTLIVKGYKYCNSTNDITSCVYLTNITGATSTITYNANGGSATAPSSQTKWYGKSLTLQTYSGTKTGYTFKGWSTSSTATTATYASGGTMGANDITSDTTLYAVWAPQTYTVSYNTNGGSGTAPSSQTKTAGSTLTLQTYSGTKTGYTFAGWSTSSTATSATWASGGTMAANAISADTTLYAVWTPNTYTVSYNVNGGSGSVTSQTKTYGMALTLQTYSGTKTGYTFAGWGTSSTATTATYASGGSMGATAITADTTLYAVWTINSYTLTVNPNGGTWSGSTSNQSYTQNYNTTKTIANPTAPSGYTVTFNGNGGTVGSSTITQTKTFSSWALSGGGSISGTTYTYGTSDGTLTAQYTSNAITLPSATRDGYVFSGWYTALSGGTKVGESGASYTPTAAITLYAQWEQNKVTITATAGVNGSITPSGTTSLDIGGGQTYTITPSDGYEVDTVKIDGDTISPTEIYTFINVTTNRTIEVTFKAVEEKSEYNLKKNINGVSVITTVPVGRTVTLRYVPKDGVTFTGWTVNLGGITLSDSTALSISFTMPMKTVEITANVE